MSLKICYIWVKDYRNFQNTGFNFASNVKFHFDNNTGILKKQNVESLPPDFFGRNITEVTGLIGKNGSGKSNALELVCKLLKGGKTALTTPFFIIVQNYNGYICYTSKVTIDNKLEEVQIQDYEKNIDPLKVIYFSNVFDERDHNFGREVSDISNNYRYKRNRYPYTLSTKTSDFEKQIRFITSESRNIVDIQNTSKIRISSKLWNREVRNSYQRKGIPKVVDDKLYDFLSIYKERINGLKDENRVYNIIIYVLFYDLVKDLNREFDRNKNFNPVPSFALYGELESVLNNIFSEKFISTEDISQQILEWLHNVFSQKFYVEFFRSPKEIPYYEKCISILKDYRYGFPEWDIKFKSEGSRSRKLEYFVIDSLKLKNSKFTEFLKIFYNTRLFSIDWVGISSGYKAYLNVFSLLQFELKRVRKQNALICIDEGDLYLHPQWQIEFFSKLIALLPQIYDGKIQLILTSHSPFLLSDLPKQNITIIDSELLEQSSSDGIQLEKETFAGNIYNLYAEPFFLKNQRTSIFAKNKIERLIKQFDKDTQGVTKAERKRLEKEINLIGDEVIRFHLLKKLDND